MHALSRASHSINNAARDRPRRARRPRRASGLLPVATSFATQCEASTASSNVDERDALVKVPFDIDHWRRVAEEAGPLAGALVRRPDPVALRGSPRGLDRAAAGRSWSTSRLPLARAARVGRPDRARRPRRHRLSSLGARRASRRRASAGAPRSRLWSDLVAGAYPRAPCSLGVEEDGSRLLASRRVLQGALPGVQEPPLRLAHLGRPQGRLLGARQLPPARSKHAPAARLHLPRRLDRATDGCRRGRGRRRRGTPGRCTGSRSGVSR